MGKLTLKLFNVYTHTDTRVYRRELAYPPIKHNLVFADNKI